MRGLLVSFLVLEIIGFKKGRALIIESLKF
jgi:hypothetical protein